MSHMVLPSPTSHSVSGGPCSVYAVSLGIKTSYSFFILLYGQYCAIIDSGRRQDIKSSSPLLSSSISSRTIQSFVSHFLSRTLKLSSYHCEYFQTHDHVDHNGFVPEVLKYTHGSMIGRTIPFSPKKFTDSLSLHKFKQLSFPLLTSMKSDCEVWERKAFTDSNHACPFDIILYIPPFIQPVAKKHQGLKDHNANSIIFRFSCSVDSLESEYVCHSSQIIDSSAVINRFSPRVPQQMLPSPCQPSLRPASLSFDDIYSIAASQVSDVMQQDISGDITTVSALNPAVSPAKPPSSLLSSSLTFDLVQAKQKKKKQKKKKKGMDCDDLDWMKDAYLLDEYGDFLESRRRKSCLPLTFAFTGDCDFHHISSIFSLLPPPYALSQCHFLSIPHHSSAGYNHRSVFTSMSPSLIFSTTSSHMEKNYFYSSVPIVRWRNAYEHMKQSMGQFQDWVDACLKEHEDLKQAIEKRIMKKQSHGLLLRDSSSTRLSTSSTIPTPTSTDLSSSSSHSVHLFKNSPHCSPRMKMVNSEMDTVSSSLSTDSSSSSSSHMEKNYFYSSVPIVRWRNAYEHMKQSMGQFQDWVDACLKEHEDLKQAIEKRIMKKQSHGLLLRDSSSTRLSTSSTIPTPTSTDLSSSSSHSVHLFKNSPHCSPRMKMVNSEMDTVSSSLSTDSSSSSSSSHGTSVNTSTNGPSSLPGIGGVCDAMDENESIFISFAPQLPAVFSVVSPHATVFHNAPMNYFQVYHISDCLQIERELSEQKKKAKIEEKARNLKDNSSNPCGLDRSSSSSTLIGMSKQLSSPLFSHKSFRKYLTDMFKSPSLFIGERLFMQEYLPYFPVVAFHDVFIVQYMLSVIDSLLRSAVYDAVHKTPRPKVDIGKDSSEVIESKCYEYANRVCEDVFDSFGLKQQFSCLLEAETIDLDKSEPNSLPSQHERSESGDSYLSDESDQREAPEHADKHSSKQHTSSASSEKEETFCVWNWLKTRVTMLFAGIVNRNLQISSNTLILSRLLTNIISWEGNSLKFSKDYPRSARSKHCFLSMDIDHSTLYQPCFRILSFIQFHTYLFNSMHFTEHGYLTDPLGAIKIDFTQSDSDSSSSLSPPVKFTPDQRSGTIIEDSRSSIQFSIDSLDAMGKSIDDNFFGYNFLPLHPDCVSLPKFRKAWFNSCTK
ncbi:hypothetical protein ADUPG1_009666 [Aduncisulcus paluster]|uniref:Uncharacterized protein n=1 Tax=Aduncisulcus paluster TaxID=2918883 RepID=A0ABQ5KWF0_9EUKA|nr:hypothetical protein ADUPG1_009666 [Aduncisulcus paluster]